MDTTVRATCPKCRTVLKIPAQWVGQAVKCKKCGSIVRSRPKASDTPLPQANGTAEATANGQQAPAENAFDFSKKVAADQDWPIPEPLVPPAPEQPNQFDPTAGADGSAQPAQPVPGMPTYPYPVPPGYPPPGAYGMPPGYPYAPPPGYPYPAPGYGYPVPPGYAPPAGYGVPPGYPYAVPPADPNAPTMPPAAIPGAAYPYPAPYPAPAAPVPAVPAAPVPVAPAVLSPNAPLSKPAAPAGNAPASSAKSDPIPTSNEFKTDAPLPSGNRYRRAQNKNKWVWAGVCVVLTAGLVAGGIFGAKYLNEKLAKEKKELDPMAKLVEQLGSSDASARDEAFTKLKGHGTKAEDALKEGVKSDKADVAQKCKDLLALLAPATPGPGGTTPNTGTPIVKAGQFPRRMLFISISKYMYLNPLTYAEVRNGIIGQDKTRPAALRLSYEWNVPNDPKSTDGNQLFLLSDSAVPEGGKGEVLLPMKNVVMGTYERFFETSRAQDRIVVYFGGHALEKDGKAYIAPIEADLDEPEASLIPLSEFYDKLKACKATQKVIIWDVCRYNPERGKQGPGSEPMTDTLYKALAAAPEGTEVVLTCQPGENALEFFNLQAEVGTTATAVRFAGSAFLESVRAVAAKSSRNPGKQPTPADPINVADWTAAVARKTREVAELSTVGLKQTIKVEGKMLASQVAYNAAEPLAKRFEVPVPPKGTSPAEIASIVNEFNVPPISREVTDAGISNIAFRDEVMKDFKADATYDEIMADKEKYKLRVATLAALDKIRKMWSITPGATGGPEIRQKPIPAPINDKIKNEIKNEQEFWAIGIAELELLNAELDSVKSLKEAEPKRWQAHYEYARAVLKARLAYMNEYNKLMGDVLTETLPSLDMKLGQDSYKLVTSEKMKSKRDVQKLAEEAKEAYEKLVTEFKGTPWAIQAKRDKSFPLGLSWQAFSSGDK